MPVWAKLFHTFMNNIALAKKLSLLPGEGENQARVVIEPLAPGYGTTIGNAVRRVLLASLPGVAVIGAKIENATHEFMALPNIKEDVLEILLNLKQLRLRLDEGVDEARLELHAFGEKTVTAADITKQAGVEIISKDIVIAHLTDMGGRLDMEIFVRRGVGYETIESREEKKKELGYIDVDSIYSPVLTVGLDIENVRVGKMVNWEKLVLNIETDGTMTPEEAFKVSATILIDQLTAVRDLPANESVTETEIVDTDMSEANDISSKSEDETIDSDEVTEEKKEKKTRKKKVATIEE